jgi:4-hydroxy-tetrahydrodipicolinate reductase
MSPGRENSSPGHPGNIRIIGDPNISLSNCPEVPGGKGTYASTGNYIPLIGGAVPGIVTIVDMPLPRFAAPTA